MGIEFPCIKLLDYRKKWDELEQSKNPFAFVVMAHLKTQETQRNMEDRYRWKVELTKNLYRQGLKKQDILNLYLFIDWIMEIPEELDEAFYNEIREMEEEKKMPYISTAERIGIKKGKEIGLSKGLSKGELIGKILLSEEMLKRKSSSKKELMEKSLKELNEIFRGLKVDLTNIVK